MGIDIIGIENPIMDFNILLDKMPDAGGFASLKEYSWQGGGNVGSALVAAARLGAKCGVVGIVGDDGYGQFCIDDFRRHNIDTSHLIKDAGNKTSFVICLAEISTKGRSFIAKPGTRRQPTITELDKDYLSTTKYIHLGPMGQPQVQAAVWAKEMGITVVDDAGYFNSDTDAHTDLIDVFVGSEHYYKGLFNDNHYENNCKSIQKRGPRIVVFTLGAKGCVGIDGDQYFTVPAFNNISIVDTTGAGDVFHGAFIFGLLQGWDLKKTSLFSSAVSAIKCTRLGGRAAIPDYNTVQKFIETGTIDYTEIDKRVEYYREGILHMQPIQRNS
jgi:sugar/nucleoside kinase (ribokinase family)